jgi:hypothetical protein
MMKGKNMEKTIKKRGRKAIKGKASATELMLKKARKKQHVNYAALAVARWLN